MDTAFGGFKCLDHGHSRYACNIMEGVWEGFPVTAFDYHYTTGSGKNSSHHSMSAAVVASAVALKPLTIRREGIFDKLTEFFGYDDIDFESAEFSRTFHVTSPDRRWAYDVIHQRMMEFLLTAPAFSVEFGITHVIAMHSRKMGPAQFEEALNLILGMLQRLPDYLVRQQTAGTNRL